MNVPQIRKLSPIALYKEIARKTIMMVRVAWESPSEPEPKPRTFIAIAIGGCPERENTKTVSRAYPNTKGAENLASV